jgi:hypothetical protein
MASVNANGASGVAGEGFVTVVSLVPRVGMAAAGAPTGANVQPLPAAGGNGDAATANSSGVRPPMRWTNNTHYYTRSFCSCVITHITV